MDLTGAIEKIIIIIVGDSYWWYEGNNNNNCIGKTIIIIVGGSYWRCDSSASGVILRLQARFFGFRRDSSALGVVTVSVRTR